MSEHAKPTPGPWDWVKSPEYGYSALVGADGQEVLVPGGINDGDRPITWMGEEMSEADARLIAAAPELLEAVSDIVRADDAHRSIWEKDLPPAKRDRLLSDNDKHKAGALAKARAAIAKAGGAA